MEDAMKNLAVGLALLGQEVVLADLDLGGEIIEGWTYRLILTCLCWEVSLTANLDVSNQYSTASVTSSCL